MTIQALRGARRLLQTASLTKEPLISRGLSRPPRWTQRAIPSNCYRLSSHDSGELPLVPLLLPSGHAVKCQVTAVRSAPVRSAPMSQALLRSTSGDRHQYNNPVLLGEFDSLLPPPSYESELILSEMSLSFFNPKPWMTMSQR